MAESDADGQVEREPFDVSRLFVRGAYLSMVAALVAIYLPVLCGQLDYCAADLTYIYQPVCAYIGKSLSQGRFPLWNPQVYCGMSQIALISPGLFYPFNYLLFLLPFSQGLALYLVLHQSIAGAGAYLYARALHLSRAGATACMLGLGFCGYAFAMQKFPDYVAACAWLPVTLYCAAHTQSPEEPRRPWFLAGLALSIFLLVAAGRPEIMVPSLIALAVQSVCLSLINNKSQSKGKQTLTLLVTTAGATAAGIMLAGPILLPGAEGLALSPRAQGLEAIRLFKWSANWLDWLSIFFINPLGDLQQFSPTFNPVRAILHNGHDALPLLGPVFMGIPITLLAILGLVCSRRKLVLVLLLLGLASALLAAGDHFPLAPWLLNLAPKLGFLRFPVKLLFFPIFVLVLLAGLGIDVLIKFGNSAQPAKLGRLPVLLALLPVVVLALLASPPPVQVFGSIIRALAETLNVALSASQLAEAESALSLSLGTQAGWGGLLAGLIAFLILVRRNEKLVVAGLLATLTAPLAQYGLYRLSDCTAAGYFTRTPAASLLLSKVNASPAERILYINPEPLATPSEYIAGDRRRYFEIFYQFARDNLIPNTQLSTNWCFANGYLLAETQALTELLHPLLHAYMHNPERSQEPSVYDLPTAFTCQLTDSHYVVTRRSDDNGQILTALDPTRFQKLAEDAHVNLRVYRTVFPSARFYFASAITPIENWSGFQNAGTARAGLSLVADKCAFIGTADQSAAAHPAGGATTPSGSINSSNANRLGSPSIQLMVDNPEHLVLAIRKKHPGFLVVKDQYYPGWHAEIDGQPTPIIRTNMFNRGLAVPAGLHKIELRYQPDSLVNSIEVACAGLLLLALLIVVARRQGF